MMMPFWRVILDVTCNFLINNQNIQPPVTNAANEQDSSAPPLVSIITPVLNGALWIEDCIQSVLIQNYPDIEHIIIDGGSSDDTLKICQKYAHLIIHSGKDRGQSHAINKGFDMARGEILAWLCADDV